MAPYFKIPKSQNPILYITLSSCTIAAAAPVRHACGTGARVQGCKLRCYGMQWDKILIETKLCYIWIPILFFHFFVVNLQCSFHENVYPLTQHTKSQPFLIKMRFQALLMWIVATALQNLLKTWVLPQPYCFFTFSSLPTTTHSMRLQDNVHNALKASPFQSKCVSMRFQCYLQRAKVQPCRNLKSLEDSIL